MKKYFIKTFGCQANINDGERIVKKLENIGYQETLKMEGAGLIVFNMCSVRQSAVDRIHGKIKDFRKIRKENQNTKTLLTGCILKKDLKKFASHFDYILSIKSLPYWQSFLKKQKHFHYPDQTKRKENIGYFKIKAKNFNDLCSLIPVSTGCNNFCSYCVVPYTRGPEICRSHKEILKEIKESLKKGVKEVWLLGQNVNSYKSPENLKINFPKLLEMANGIPGDFWIRFTSPHPKDFSNELIEVMNKCEKVTDYLNLPMQSGDNKILKKMNRSYTVEKYRKLVEKIRKKIPNITLSTDVIVGFSGENNKNFENTVKLFKEIKFDMAYISQYSPRPGISIKMQDNIPKKEKEKREKILTKILKQTALEKNKRHIGKEIRMLPSNWKKGYLLGKSFNYKTVKIKGSKKHLGKFLKVKIIKAGEWGLFGKIQNEK